MSFPKTGSTNDWRTTQNALSTSAEVISPERSQVYRVTVKNTDGAITVYIGDSATVDSSTGFPLRAGESVSIYTSAAVYAIAASGTPTVAIMVEEQT